MRRSTLNGARAAWCLPILCLSLLAGCQHTPPQTVASPSLTAEPAPEAAPATPQEWEGRMSIKLDAHEGREAEGLSLSFHLQVQGAQGHLSLMTPLGTQMAQIHWNPERAELRDTEGTREFATLSELSEALLGEALPLEVLPHWLDGRPDPELPSTAQDSPLGFTQAGWTVDLAGLERSLIIAQRPAQPGQRGITLRARLLR